MLLGMGSAAAPGDLQCGRDGSKEVFGAIVSLCLEQLVRSGKITGLILRYMRDWSVRPAKITGRLTFDVPAHEVVAARRVFEDLSAPPLSPAPASVESRPMPTVYFMPAAVVQGDDVGSGQGESVKFMATKAATEYLSELASEVSKLSEPKEDHRRCPDDFLGLLLDHLRVEAPHTAVSFLNAIGHAFADSHDKARSLLEKVTANTDRSLQLTCATCGENAAQAGVSNLKKCARCRTPIRYCSASCQKADWPQHKLVCRPRPENHDAASLAST